jgi:ubiquinone/menaquinone biosynthesis C-methylase UbiE
MAYSSHVCTWRLAQTLDNPIRRWLHSPKKIFGQYIKSGQTVLDLGCGPGVFSIAMAKMVGEKGLVIAVDIQEEMLQILKRKAEREGLQSRIVTHKSELDRIGINGIKEKADFALAFYMIHEVEDRDAFLKETASALKPKGKLLIVEPKLHVSADDFLRTVQAARRAGLKTMSEPKIFFSRSMLFELI